MFHVERQQLRRRNFVTNTGDTTGSVSEYFTHYEPKIFFR